MGQGGGFVQPVVVIPMAAREAKLTDGQITSLLLLSVILFAGRLVCARQIQSCMQPTHPLTGATATNGLAREKADNAVVLLSQE